MFADPGGWWAARLLAGLVLLTVAVPVSWVLFGAFAVAEEMLWAAVGGYSVHLVVSAAVSVLIIYVDTAFILFGLARLADMVAQLRAAHGELAGLAVQLEGLRGELAVAAAARQRARVAGYS